MFSLEDFYICEMTPFSLNQVRPLLNFQVISLGDTIKFSLSPSTTKDRLSTNVSGVPIDDSNLVR